MQPEEERITLYDIVDKQLYRNPDAETLLSTAVAKEVDKSLKPEDLASGTISGNLEIAGGYMQTSNFESGVLGWKINSDGSAEFQNINIGHTILSVSPGENIQTALDLIDAAGGGEIFLKAGTHTLTGNLTVPSSIQIYGENQSSTIIDCDSSAYQLIIAGTDMYTTGTILSVTAGGTTVNGSGTSWLANLSGGQQIFINNEWHLIAAVTGDTTIILAEPYIRESTYAGTYRAGTVAKDVEISELTIKDSSTTAIDLDDVRDFRMEDVLLLSNNKGFTMDNSSYVLIETSVVTNSTSSGYEITNANFCNLSQVASPSNGVHGAVLNNMNVGTLIYSSSNGNTTDGVNATDVENYTFILEVSDNGSNGIEFVSGCNECSVSLIAQGNTSDGAKLTATSDDNNINISQIKSNGGYGVNIAAASVDNTIVLGNHISGNSSGQVADSGTATLIRSNIGQADN